MSPQQLNPITAPLSLVKQVGEQVNLNLQNLGTGFATAASQGIDTLIAAAPTLPGMGNQGNTAPAGMRLSQMPTIQGLLPANLQNVLSQVENLIIPAGLPRPSQAMAPPAAPPAEEAAAAAGAPTPTRPRRTRVLERRGI